MLRLFAVVAVVIAAGVVAAGVVIYLLLLAVLLLPLFIPWFLRPLTGRRLFYWQFLTFLH